jgi:hypothetical protein
MLFGLRQRDTMYVCMYVNAVRLIQHIGHAVAQWLRHCATNRKVAGSIPNGVIGIFHGHNPFGRTLTLEST